MKNNLYFLILIFVILLLLLSLSRVDYKDKNLIKNINKKIVFITGSSSGIGKTFYDYLDKKGYLVITHGRSKINNNYHIQCDISKSIDPIINYIQKIGQIDIFINNFYDSKKKDARNNLSTNLVKSIELTDRMIPHIKEKGKIIFISSGIADSVSHHNDFVDMYSIIKSSIDKYMKVMSNKYYSKKIAFSSLKIDNTYKTNLTKEYKNLQKDDELFKLNRCLDFIIQKPWSDLTGRIFYSSKIIDHKIFFDLEINYPYLDEKKDEQTILGENPIRYSGITNTKNLKSYHSDENDLYTTLSKKYNIDEKNIKFYRGTINFLEKLVNLFVKENHQILFFDTSWVIMENIALNREIINTSSKIINHHVQPDFDDMLNKITSLTRMIYIVGPIDKRYFEYFLNKVPSNIPIIIDLCYNDYYSYPSFLDLKDILRYDNYILGLNTFSKFYGLPGINLGFCVAKENILNMISNFIHYKINRDTIDIAIKALQDEEYQNKVKNFYNKEKQEIIHILKTKNIDYSQNKPMHLIAYIELGKRYDNLINSNKLNNFISRGNGYTNILIDKPENNRKIKQILNKILN